MIEPINAYQRIQQEIDKSDNLDAITKIAIKATIMNGLLDEMAWQSDQDHKERMRALTISNELKK